MRLEQQLAAKSIFQYVVYSLELEQTHTLSYQERKREEEAKLVEIERQHIENRIFFIQCD